MRNVKSYVGVMIQSSEEYSWAVKKMKNKNKIIVPEGIGQKIDSRGVYWFEDMCVLRFRRTITIREGTFFNEGGGGRGILEIFCEKSRGPPIS